MEKIQQIIDESLFDGKGVIIHADHFKWIINEFKRLDEVIKDRTGDIVYLYEENKQLKAYIENNEFDLYPEFQRYFPKGVKGIRNENSKI